MRELRTERNLRQDEIAAEARAYGLPWTRATVAAIETGRREISLDELPGLVLTLGVEMPQLLTHRGAVKVAGGVESPGRLVQAVFEGKALKQASWSWGEPSADSRDLAQRVMARVEKSRRLSKAWPGASEAEVVAAAGDAAGEVERRAAQRLGVDPLALALAARRRWQHSLTEERDLRTPPGQTSTGHITRALLDELRPDLVAAGLLRKGH